MLGSVIWVVFYEIIVINLDILRLFIELIGSVLVFDWKYVKEINVKWYVVLRVFFILF